MDREPTVLDEGEEAHAADPAPVPSRLPRWALPFVVCALLVALWILGRTVRLVVVLFVAAALVALLLNPLVRLLQRSRAPRGLAVCVVWLSFAAGAVGAGYLIFSPARDQLREISRNLPAYGQEAEQRAASLQAFLARHGIHVNLVRRVADAVPSLEAWAARQTGHLLSYGVSVVQGIVAVVVVLVASTYMLLGAPRIERAAGRLGRDGDLLLRRTERRLGRYLRAQLLVSLIIATTVGVTMAVFGLAGLFPAGETYAVAFAVWAFFMEFIPYVGPVLEAVPPIVIALFSSSGVTALWVLLAFVAIQQLEGHIVVPQVMGGAVGVPPLLVIFALLTGAALSGPLGVLLAIPLMVVLRELVAYGAERMGVWVDPLPHVPLAPEGQTHARAPER
jgi:predicted PurR-regulated permease PerM